MTGAGDGRAPSVELGPEDRDQPAGRVFALALERLLDDMRRHEAAVVAGDDPEELHDYRVALRRARSVLGAGSAVFPAEELELLQALTAGLADATSPVRDLDVLLDSFDDLASDLSPELRDGLEPLRSGLGSLRTRAHDELVALIGGETHEVLLRRWQVMASVHRIGGSDPGPDALRPAGEVVDELIGSAYRRVVDKGRKLVESDDPDDWHTVRKRLKRLRYLLTSFGSLYPDGIFGPMPRELSELQDRFGVLQDHVAQARLIESVGGSLGGRAGLAAGAVADGLHRRVLERDVRRCRKRFRRIGSKEVRRSVRRAVGR